MFVRYIVPRVALLVRKQFDVRAVRKTIVCDVMMMYYIIRNGTYMENVPYHRRRKIVLTGGAPTKA